MADQSMTITVPSSDVADFVDAYCTRFGYDANSGVTKNVFVRNCIKQMIREPLATYRRAKAEQTAIAGVVTTSDTVTVA